MIEKTAESVRVRIHPKARLMAQFDRGIFQRNGPFFPMWGIRLKSKGGLVERIYRYLDEVNLAPVRFPRKFKLDEIIVS
jgi:hypothetical protein